MAIYIPHGVTGLGLVQLQVEEPVIGGIQYPQPISLWVHGYVWICITVDNGGVHESFWHYGRVWRPRDILRFPGRIDRVIVWVQYLTESRGEHRPEPGTIVHRPIAFAPEMSHGFWLGI